MPVTRSVRDRRYKLLIKLNPEIKSVAVQLFDLEQDSAENHNLAKDPALKDVRERLKQELLRWRQHIGDSLLDAGRITRWIAAAEYFGSLPKTVKCGDKTIRELTAEDLERWEVSPALPRLVVHWYAGSPVGEGGSPRRTRP